MEEIISAPNIVKGIPVPLIRPLPTLYYYGRYATDHADNNAAKFFEGSVAYLVDAIKAMDSEIAHNGFSFVAEIIADLVTAEKNTIVDKVVSITSQLSNLCSKNSDNIKNNPKFSKENLAQLYRSRVQPLKILLIDNNNEPQRVDKLSETFQSTCFYDVTIIRLHAARFVDKVHSSDFIIFASAYPIAVNEEVQNIQQYKKPCLIMANLIKDKKFDQQTIRNGNWLQSRGHEVLYKIFTPLRLFTTIDKAYIKFQFSVQ